MAAEEDSFTQLLHSWRAGDAAALERLTPLVYRELRRLAGHYLANERPGHTLQPTALLHEAYLRLQGQQDAGMRNRAHFMAIAAQHMRQILVDHARKRNAAKRGAGMAAELDEATMFAPERSADLVALDDGLRDLAKVDERKARAVELRYFGGLGLEEIAEVLGVHANTVKTDLRSAQAWLKAYLSGEV